MPVMDGLEAVRRIKSEPQTPKSEMKFVSLSASALAHEQEQYQATGFDDFIAKPFRFERICECLARLLDAQFENAASVVDAKSATASDLPDSLPAEILSRLRDAAERRSVTRLEKCIDELENLDEPGRQAAGYLRRLVHAGDLDSVSSFLDKVKMA
jgi:DNA-binding response OmpR family regulator